MELVIALMVFSLLIVTVQPLLTTSNRAHVEKEMRLKGLWLAQEHMEKQMAHTAENLPGSGRSKVRLDGKDYEVSWKRTPIAEGLHRVEVSVLWEIIEEMREIHLERYVFME